jgi:hypothetical protein
MSGGGLQATVTFGSYDGVPGRSGRRMVERRGWDSNPRRPGKGAAVFKTAPFDRSGTPPTGAR